MSLYFETRKQHLAGFFMDVESFVPFLLILAPFALAFFIETLVLYFFKLKSFWAGFGIIILINLVALAIIYYAGGPLLGKLGYAGQFNGLDLPLQVIAFLCWLSIIIDGLLLSLFLKQQEKKRIYTASIIMNILSFLFLHLFIAFSH